MPRARYTGMRACTRLYNVKRESLNEYGGDDNIRCQEIKNSQ